MAAPKKPRKVKPPEQTVMFGEIPENARLRMELATAKDNFETLQKQFDDLVEILRPLRDENEYLRRQLGL